MLFCRKTETTVDCTESQPKHALPPYDQLSWVSANSSPSRQNFAHHWLAAELSPDRLYNVGVA
jgi:hypothetical protein